MDHYHWNRDFRLHYLQGEHLFTLVNMLQHLHMLKHVAGNEFS